MILVIFLIGIALVVAGFVVDEGWDEGIGLWVVGSLISAIALVAAIFTGVSLSLADVADEKIAMYEEENAVIEEQIAIIVEQYQEYETDIFENAKVESPITYVSMYPELKSDSLVQKQIEIYVANNDKIKELKNEAINKSVYRWWLYFGR